MDDFRIELIRITKENDYKRFADSRYFYRKITISFFVAMGQKKLKNDLNSMKVSLLVGEDRIPLPEYSSVTTKPRLAKLGEGDYKVTFGWRETILNYPLTLIVTAKDPEMRCELEERPYKQTKS